MRVFKIIAAAALVALPLLATSAPAEALTARQYQHQGRGHYVSSTGNRPSRAIYHHRHQRPHYGHHRSYR